jgi:aminopeptidase N
MITCGTWADIWLNEGFATWSEAFWYESYSGYNAYKSDINNDANWYLATNAGWPISDPAWAITTPNVNILFDYSITYMKGACVLHQLRYVLGDSLFFQTLHTYCADTNYKFKSATIPDFKGVVNQVTGQDYSWFFNEWIYWANHPVYQNTYNFENLGNNQWKVNLQVVQSQTNAPFFKMPVDILIRYVDATDTTIRIMSDVNYQQFSWIVNKEPKVFKFDPDKQIVLKAGSTAVGITDRNLPGTHAMLLQNAPNPASGITRIDYSIDRPANVVLRLTDLYGQTLRTLTEERQPAGSYGVDVDCSSLNPGNYLIVLNAGDSRQVRKMVVIR